MKSRKNYDRPRNRAAQQCPFIRDVGGKRRFFWLTSVVTHEGGVDTNRGNFIVGAAPDITLTDAACKTVVWVDSKNLEEWEQQLEEELSSIWSLN